MFIIILALVVLLIEFFLIELLPTTRTQKNNLAYIIVFVQLLILSGRFGLENIPDRDGYAFHFQNLRSDGPFYKINLNDRFGVGYLFFEKFIHNVITDSMLHYDIITAFITLFATFYFFKKYSHYAWLTLFLFVSLRLCLSELIAVRQAMALVVGFFAYYSLRQKRNILYFLLVLIAMTFHNSAYILLLFFLMERIKINKKSYFIFTVGLVIVFYFYGYILENYILQLSIDDSKYYDNSIDKNMFAYIGLFNAIIAIVLFTIILFLNRRSLYGGRLEKENTFIAFTYLAIAIMSIRLSVLSRFEIYLLPFVIVYISNLIYYLPCKWQKHLMIFILVLFSVSTSLFLFSVRPEWVINLK
jgi:hypothetical protein